MARTNTCPITGHQLAPGQHLSPEGLDQLRNQINTTIDLYGLLDLALTKQLRKRTTAGSTRVARTTQPLPYNAAASEMRDVIADTLTAWATGYGHHTTNATAAGQWLADNISHHATREEAKELHEALQAVNRDATHIIDNPPQLICLGRCPHGTCTRIIYAPEHKPATTCRTCGGHVQADSQRAEMMQNLYSMSHTATECVEILNVFYNIQIKENRIRLWKSRGHLEPVGQDMKRRNLYSLPEIIKLFSKNNR